MRYSLSVYVYRIRGASGVVWILVLLGSDLGGVRWNLRLAGRWGCAIGIFCRLRLLPGSPDDPRSGKRSGAGRLVGGSLALGFRRAPGEYPAAGDLWVRFSAPGAS